METFKRVTGIVIRVLLIIVLAILVLAVTINLALNIQKNNGNDRPNIFGLAPISITDNKIAPILNEGDFLIIASTNKFKIGDLVTTERSGNYVTQEIVKIEYYEGREDVKYLRFANGSSAIPSMIYGKVVIKMGGFAPVVEFFQSVPGVSVLVGVAILIIFMPIIFSSSKKEGEKGKLKK